VIRAAKAILLTALTAMPMASARPDVDKSVLRSALNRVPPSRQPVPAPSPTHDDLPDGEFLIDTSVVHVPSPTGTHPRVASDSSDYLAVWSDYRDGDWDVYGTRVLGSGAVVDTTGIRICADGTNQTSPDVAYGSGFYLTAWADGRGGVYCARVDAGGSVIDPNGFPVGGSSSSDPGVAFDGTNFLVVWSEYIPPDTSHNYDIWGARVTPAGQVLDSAPLRICTAALTQQYPRLAFGYSAYFVVWGDYRIGGVYGGRVLPNGAVLDPTGIPVDTHNYSHRDPDVAFDGTNYLVAWTGYRRAENIGDIYAARVTQSGTVLDPSSIRVSYQHYVFTPRAAFSGGRFVVVWWNFDDYSFYEGQVTPDGRLIDTLPQLLYLSPYGFQPEIVTNGQNCLLAAGLHYGQRGSVYLARLDVSGRPLDSCLSFLVWCAQYQSSPTVSYDGSDFLAVWADRGKADWNIYGARISGSGELLDQARIAICTTAGDQTQPVVASDGANYFVVWNNPGDTTIRGARITPGGVVLDPNGFLVSRSYGNQRVVYDGNNYFVVWAGSGGPYAARVSPTGVLLDTTPIVISNSGGAGAATVDAGDSNLLVAWNRERYVGSPHPHLMFTLLARRVSRSGQLLGSEIELAPEREYGSYHPVAAFDGVYHFVVWDANMGSRVTQSGFVFSPIRFSGLDGCEAIAPRGSELTIAWSAGRHIHGARVITSGQVLDTFTMAAQSGSQTSPAVAMGSDARLMLCYSGWVGTEGGRIYNTTRIWGKLGPFGGIAEGGRHRIGLARAIDGASILRGVLRIPESHDPNARLALLDISGRKVLELHPGPNDVSRLAPGVYFVRSGLSAASRDAPGSGEATPSAVYKVVIQR
jgi:hypothetical protein